MDIRKIDYLDTGVITGNVYLITFGTNITTMYVERINGNGKLVLNNVYIKTLKVDKMNGNSDLIIKNSIIDNFEKRIINGRIVYINSIVNGIWYDYYVEE
ncbi:hypothetical protein KKP89_02990 [Methanothermococcus sp. SCGC AD-155-N22]|nr:hypothetical protein [Methanothermococcus sp. SCGC AD-155-N22]